MEESDKYNTVLTHSETYKSDLGLELIYDEQIFAQLNQFFKRYTLFLPKYNITHRTG